MGAKTLIQSLIQKTIQGQLENVYNSINNNKLNLEQEVALKLVVACCNVCYKNLASPKIFDEKDLVKLLKLILAFIKTELTDCESYLQSVFYIMKWFIDKNDIACILDLQELLIPEFLPVLQTDMQKSLYQNICKVVYNTIVKISKERQVNRQCLVLELCYLLLALHKKGHSCRNFVFESVYNCTIVLTTMNIDCENIFKLYESSFDFVDSNKDTALYCLLVKNFSFLYAHLLKNEKFKLANDCYAATLMKLSCFKGQEYKCLHEVLEIVHWTNPLNQDNSTEVLVKVHRNLKSYYRQYNSTSNLQAVCDVISSAAFMMLAYYKGVNHSQWLKLSIQVHLELYKCLYDVSHIMNKAPYQCHCKTCATKTNVNEALKILSVITGLGCLYIKNKPEVARSYKVDLFRYIEKFTDLVAALKANDCVKWKIYWSEVSSILYKIGFDSLKKKDTETCILHLKKFVQVSLRLEAGSSSAEGKNHLSWVLAGIADAYLESRDYEKILFTCAFNIILSRSENEINRWIRTKAACRENSIQEDSEMQELTWLSVCRKFETDMNFYDPDNSCGVKDEEKIELLILELARYKLKWKSKVPMMAVYRELSQIADSTTCARIFIETWGDCKLQVHDSVPKLLHSTVKRFEADTITNRNAQAKFYLAYLYFLRHIYRVKDIAIKHCNEMERTMMNVTKAVNENEPIPPDPNEECDIVSTYESLKLSVFLQMMIELDKSLDTLGEIFVNDEYETVSELDKLFELLTKIGEEYELHCQSARALQAWRFALKVARFDNNKLHQLKAITSIIELSEFANIQQLIAVADKVAASFQAERCHAEDVIRFYLCKSESYFYVDFDVSYATFKHALKLHLQECGDNKLLQARINLLHHKFVMLPCHYPVEDHTEYSLVKIHQAQRCIIHHYSENLNVSAYDMKIFFDINEALVKTNLELRLPREVRCYSKEIVVLAQKMLLPLRTVAFLSYLAHADVYTIQLDDCKVKVSGISDILGLRTSKAIAKSSRSPERLKVDKIVDNLISEFNEMMLDVPSRKLKVNPGSPTLAVERFQMPSFLYHHDTCICFYCTCVEYHQYVLKKTYLHAMLHEYENNLEIAQEYFSGCIKLYHILKDKEDLCMKKKSLDFVVSPQNMFLETFCMTLYEFANFCLRSGKIKHAEKMNTKLMQTLEPVHLKYRQLYNEVLAQKLTILMEKMPQLNPTPSKTVTFGDLNVSTIEKTPEAKHNQVFITPEEAPEYVEMVKIKPKTLRFDLSDEEDNAETKKSSVKNVTFSSTAMKTPASSASKVKIYTNRSSKKKKIFNDTSPSRKEPNARMAEFLIPGPNVSTPASVKIDHKADSNLVNRTKLLTERLRSSAKKPANAITAATRETRSIKKIPAIVITDENNTETSNGTRPRRGSVRQNLLGQLEDSESGENNGAIRKSARNRK